MQNQAQIFKALADETRLRIIALLLGGELCVCELIAALELPQSTISRHLAYLRNSGWVRDRRQGVWMYYRIDSGAHPLVEALLPLLKEQLGNGSGAAEAIDRLRAFQKEQQGAC